MSCADCCASLLRAQGTSGGFEGVEKHLEIDFRPRPGASIGDGLMLAHQDEWNPVTEAARVNVLSVVSGEAVRMFLLSESSMFVMPTRLIMKTCGSTSLLLAIRPALEVAARYNLVPSFVAFHRRSYILEGSQSAPHCHFGQEVAFLRDLLPVPGQAHIVGDPQGPHTHLFIASLPRDDVEPTMSPTSPNGHALAPWDAGTFHAMGERSATLTLEVMMTDVNPDVLKQFFRDQYDEASACDVKIEKAAAVAAQEKGESISYTSSEGGNGEEPSRVFGSHVTRASKIDTLMPHSIIDAYMFEPCGYSMNGVCEGKHYWTVHITPEVEFCFVSFESSVPIGDRSDVVQRVLSLFKPEHALVRLLADDVHAELAEGLIAESEKHYKVAHTQSLSVGRNAKVYMAEVVKVD